MCPSVALSIQACAPAQASSHCKRQEKGGTIAELTNKDFCDFVGFLSTLPEVTHSNVGERGARLSVRQPRSIVLKHAITYRLAVLILDESTRALNPDCKKHIPKTLRSLRLEFTRHAISRHQVLIDAGDRLFRLLGGKWTALT